MRPVLITGGCGFIGCNLAHRLLSTGHEVMLLDSLARPGVDGNLEWLRATHADRVIPLVADIRDPAVVRDAVREAGAVYHFAAQVAVTTSLVDPLADFETNARGTVNLLEAIRGTGHRPPLVFTSTNKVYGELTDIALVERATRYEPMDHDAARYGVGAARALDFHSPYGCSKGTADQYVLDYARSFGLDTAVFRMSCIYGPHQLGTEDQGWVAHFLFRAMRGLPLVVYGDGKQVRDVLFVDDLVDALLLAGRHIRTFRGRAFNIGGGPANTTSLLELLDQLEALAGGRPEVSFATWRTGDQRWYVSDVRAFAAATGWRPRVSLRDGLARLSAWIMESSPRAGARSAATTEATDGIAVAIRG